MSMFAKHRFDSLVNAAKAEQLVMIKNDEFQNYIACLSVENEETQETEFIPLAIIPETEKFKEAVNDKHSPSE